MGIIETLLQEIGSNNTDQQVRELCDKITEEQTEVIPEYAPDGANIWLTTILPGNKKEFGFLCLEREALEDYIVVYWTLSKKNNKLRKRKVWEIKEYKAKRILEEYVKVVKFMKGE